MKNVLEYLETTEKVFPEKTGVIDETGAYSFGQLAKESRHVGTGLLRYVTPGQPVAVFMKKSMAALCGFFGIVYAGGFYTYFDPALPSVRMGQIAEILHLTVVLTDKEHICLAKDYFPAAECLCIEELMQTAEDTEKLARIRAQQIDTDPLYVNFTSGSTGAPKGVVVSHSSVLDFTDVFAETFGFDKTERIANQAPFDFDVSVKDIYTAIKTGATLVLVPRELFSRPVELLDFLCEQKITTMIWAVSALCLVSMFHGLDYKCPVTVRKVLFSGEVMPMKQLKDWMVHLPEAEFVNLYGPTEITCNCTYHVIRRDREYAEGIPIGRAFANEAVFLMDAQRQRVTEPGAVGEICVRGRALALGYYGDALQTSQAFVQNPLHQHYLDPVYRTGDLGRYDADGELYFAGRKDFQIKYRGHRIELEEIERAMAKVAGVERCVCVFDEKKSRLYGFYTGTIDKKDLREALSKALPPFMLPERLVARDSFILTKNGKIDRKLLLKEVTAKKGSTVQPEAGKTEQH